MSVATVQRSRAALSIDDELDLIKQAQSDKTIMSRLLAHYEDFVLRMAQKIAKFTGAVRYEEDIAQIGRISVYEHVFKYDFDYVARRKSEDPGYQPARLSSYAFRDMRRRMLKHACTFLEDVSLSLYASAQAAHRDLEAGGDPEEIAKRRGMAVDTVKSLERHSISWDKWFQENEDELFCGSNESLESVAAEEEEKKDKLLLCFYPLSSRQKMILVMLYDGVEPDMRAKVLGIDRGQLGIEEQRARKRFCKLVKKHFPDTVFDKNTEKV